MFVPGALAGFVGGANYCTTSKICIFNCRQQSHLSV